MLPALFVLLYDAWLYWTHRALHRWGQRVHAVHHGKYDVQFHLLEHTVLYGPMGIAIYLNPWFGLTLSIVVGLATLAIHRRMYNWLNFPVRWGLEFWITPHYHKLHHKGYDGNYALFLTYWDRLAGTRVKEL